MTGWELLEDLAERADNKPETLDAEIWIAINNTYAKPQEMNFTYDKLSGEKGLFIKYEREENIYD